MTNQLQPTLKVTSYQCSFLLHSLRIDVDLQIFPWPNLFRLYILCIFYPQIMVSFSDEREMSVYRTDGALPKRSVLEKEFIAILGVSNQNQKNFQYLVAFDDGLPQSVTFKGESITKYGYNMIISYNYLS